MPEKRLERMRGTLPEGYQFGDAAGPPTPDRYPPEFPQIGNTVSVRLPERWKMEKTWTQ